MSWPKEGASIGHLYVGADPLQPVIAWLEHQKSQGFNLPQMHIFFASESWKVWLLKALSSKYCGPLPKVHLLQDEAEEDSKGRLPSWWWIIKQLDKAANKQGHIPQNWSARCQLADDILILFEEWLNDAVAQPPLANTALMPARIAAYAAFLVELYCLYTEALHQGLLSHPAYSRVLQQQDFDIEIKGPVLIVGSTGSVAVTRKMMHHLVTEHQAHIIFPPRIGKPGDQKDISHPDHVFQAIYEQLGVENLPYLPFAGYRNDLISAMFTPAKRVQEERKNISSLPKSIFSGLRVTYLETYLHLAPLILWHYHEARKAGKILKIVSPNRRMLLLVRHTLWDHGIPFEGRLSQPKIVTPATQICLQILQFLDEKNPARILAQLCRFLFEHGHIKEDLYRELDAMLRRFAPSLRSEQWLAQVVSIDREGQAHFVWLQLDAMLKQKPTNIPDGCEALENILTSLGQSVDGLWDGCQHLDDHKISNWGELGQRLKAYWERHHDDFVIRCENPHVQFMGPMSARHIGDGHILILGLEEGHWPKAEPARGGLSTNIRQQMGLKPSLWRMALQAHDFACLLGHKSVHLVVVQELSSQPQMASQYIQKLLAVAGIVDVDLDSAFHELTNVMASSHKIVRNDPRSVPAAPPQPCPPVAVRPTHWRITDLEDWIRDPYRIYVRRILQLKELDDHERSWDARDKGILMHALLEDLARGESKDDVLQRAINRLHIGTTNDVTRYIELCHVQHVLDEAIRTGLWGHDREIFLVEEPLSLDWEVDNLPIHIYGKVDRVDRDERGWLRVVDYKTGTMPTTDMVASHLSPQLSVTALILREQGHHIDELVYIHLPENRLKPMVSARLKIENIDQLIVDLESRLRQRIRQFFDPNLPFASRVAPKREEGFHDLVEQIARFDEWSMEQDT